MSDLSNKSFRIRAPNDADTGSAGTGSDTDYGIRKYTLNTTATTVEIPGEWSGQWVAVKPVGGAVHFAFSLRAAAVVNSAATATNAGESANVGWYAANGEELHRQLPFWDPNAGKKCYLCRQGDTNSTYLLVGRV